ncbi:hypothetical protein [Sphingomonas fennica]|nr:hypothetical protein [Sphingomonas fennica]
MAINIFKRIEISSPAGVRRLPAPIILSHMTAERRVPGPGRIALAGG